MLSLINWMLLLFSLGGLILSFFAVPFFQKKRSFFTYIITGQILAYFVALSYLFYNPYWYDNEIQKKINFPEHFAWAFWESSFYQIITVPLIFGFVALVTKARSKKEFNKT